MGVARLLELLSLENFPVKIGEEQKNVFPHFKLITSSNFGLFCGVDFLKTFYWLLQISMGERF